MVPVHIAWSRHVPQELSLALAAVVVYMWMLAGRSWNIDPDSHACHEDGAHVSGVRAVWAVLTLRAGVQIACGWVHYRGRWSERG